MFVRTKWMRMRKTGWQFVEEYVQNMEIIYAE